MSYNSVVLGKISLTQRTPLDEETIWTVRFDKNLGSELFQSLQNIGHSIGGVTVRNTRMPNDYLITVPQSDAETEASGILKSLIERFIRVVDRGAQQKREVPLAVNSDVAVFGHHHQD